MMRTYGLIGFPLEHSYSQFFFNNKFDKEKIEGVKYELFPLKNIREFPGLIERYPDIHGLNVTIPYKESVIDYLDFIDDTAEKIGAVNTIQKIHSGEGFMLKGYNTDAYGFRMTLNEIITPKHKKALILGSGGASKAVQYVLETLGIQFIIASRNSSGSNQINYKDITNEIVRSHLLIINTTPLGMFPETSVCPGIPYQALSPANILYDLIYNPEETKFLKLGKTKGAKVFSGLKMLKLQAEKSWEIWDRD